jgi:outer membrane protein OmpA-like peptidoglycan-associated protein
MVMQRAKIPYFFLGLAAVLAATALVLLIVKSRGIKSATPVPVAPPVAEVVEPSPQVEQVEQVEQVVPTAVVETSLEDLGVGLATVHPEELVTRISKALETGDFQALSQLLGKQALDPAIASQLRDLAESHPRLRHPDGVREVGELELNTRSRWALQFEGMDPGRDRVYLDLKRESGKWSVEKITLPPPAGEAIPKAALADSLGIADAFIQAVLNQDFEFARAFVDPAQVSDAKIAGLCILFEEGGYTLRKSKPLRAMFQREDTVGYLANVEAVDGRQSAQFSLTLRQPPAPANWRVTEINLNQLLVEYARRVAGGDVYYSPLVKNPGGGDTLALYFEFDEDSMNPRTRRQLEIVSMILKADSGKKINLSGHTDALGTENYNQSLSYRRAQVVREFLIKAGVNPVQITTMAKGASQPRRPNVTETGEDDPEGRRANRRTEIYLDF